MSLSNCAGFSNGRVSSGPSGYGASEERLNVARLPLEPRGSMSRFDVALLYMLPLFALTTLLQELPILTYLNRVMAVIALAMVVFGLLKSGMSKWKYLLFSLYLVVTVIAVGFTEWSGQTVAAAPRGLFCISLLLYYHERHECFK